MPVYKGDKVLYFSEAVDSIMTQSYRGIRLLIGVDGPVGIDMMNYLSVLGRQNRIIIRYFDVNRGMACVLNDLLTECLKENYEFIARMDADDISMPERFEIQLKYLQNHPEVEVVGGAIAEIDEQGNSRGKTVVYPETPEACRAFFAYRNPHAHPAVMFRRSFFEKIGHMYRPEYRQNQDTMLWYDGMMAGTQHANIPDVVLKFRMTNAMFKKRRNGWAFAKKQFTDRLKINRGLHYGIKADMFGFAMFCLLVSPVWIKKIAYNIFR